MKKLLFYALSAVLLMTLHAEAKKDPEKGKPDKALKQAEAEKAEEMKEEAEAAREKAEEKKGEAEAAKEKAAKGNGRVAQPNEVARIPECAWLCRASGRANA